MSRIGFGFSPDSIAASVVPARRPRGLALLPVLFVLPLLLAWAAGPLAAQTLSVQVLDGHSSQPLSGAFVMVGPEEGVPFAGNTALTDASGVAVFSDASLASPQTVTAGIEGLGWLTLYESAQGSALLKLYPTATDSSWGGQDAMVYGEVPGISTTSNDGFYDIAIVLPTVPIRSYVLTDELPFVFRNEFVDFPVVGPVELPENTYMPNQTEYFFFTFSKSPYKIHVPDGRTHSLVSIAARISIDDAINGNINNAEIREIGVERNVQVNGDTNLNINSDLAVSASVTANFGGVPAGSRILTVSGTLIQSGGEEVAVGFDTREGNIDETTSFTLAGRNPGGDIADGVNAALGVYLDSSSELRFDLGIVDRSGFTVPHTSSFDTWMRHMVLTQNQGLFQWEDPTEPGVSPSPTWVRADLGVRPVTPGDDSVTKTVNWRILAPAGTGSFQLPVLPPDAPGPTGGLPDPNQTPEADQLYWRCVAANPSGDPQQVLDDFMTGATHWTSYWIGITQPSTNVPTADAGPDVLRLQSAPVPSRSGVDLSWSSGVRGQGTLEIFGADGRLVLSRDVDLASGRYSWNGRAGSGQAAPAGVYWARLVQGLEELGSCRIVRVQ